MRSDSRKSEEREDWRVEPVERRILPLVRALNLGPFRTLSSCEGHADRSAEPLVIFTAPVAAASALGRRVGELQEAGKLNFFWTVDGHFDTEGVLRFRVEARWNGAKATWAEFWNSTVMGRSRKRIDADIVLLARELGKAAAGLDLKPCLASESEYLAPAPDVAPLGVGLPELEARPVGDAAEGGDEACAGDGAARGLLGSALCFALTGVPLYIGFSGFTGGFWVFAAVWAGCVVLGSFYLRSAPAGSGVLLRVLGAAASAFVMFGLVTADWSRLREIPDLAAVFILWPLIGGILCGIEDAYALRGIPFGEMPARSAAWLRSSGLWREAERRRGGHEG